MAEERSMANLRLAANNALTHLHNFGPDWVRARFNVDIDDHHQLWKDVQYDWFLSEISLEGSSSLQSFLSSLHVQVQRARHGLKMVRDDMEEQDEFRESFDQADNFANALIAEINAVVDETDHLSQLSNSFLPAELKSISDSGQRHLRDWIVYRDIRNLYQQIVRETTLFEQQQSN